MSHSCTPNCQAIVMACGGRLTIALYTLRQVHEGEELTFDYSSVTESEREFREAICLCSTRNCRLGAGRGRRLGVGGLGGWADSAVLPNARSCHVACLPRRTD